MSRVREHAVNILRRLNYRRGGDYIKLSQHQFNPSFPRLGLIVFCLGQLSDSRVERNVVTLQEVVVKRAEDLLDFESGAGDAEGIVLVYWRDAEHSHDGVADVLLDRAAVALVHTPNLVEVTGHESTQHLGVE